MVTLGNLHLSGGFGVDRDYERALEYFREAMRMGDPAGTSHVAYMYANGWGVEQDHATALKLYKYVLGGRHCLNMKNRQNGVFREIY